jgi:hypothetical protein
LAGLVPAIHVTSAATVRTETERKEGVDHRVEPGDDNHYESGVSTLQQISMNHRIAVDQARA